MLSRIRDLLRYLVSQTKAELSDDRRPDQVERHQDFQDIRKLREQVYAQTKISSGCPDI